MKLIIYKWLLNEALKNAREADYALMNPKGTIGHADGKLLMDWRELYFRLAKLIMEG